MTTEKTAKKSSWKGKDWYAILAPKSFNEVRIGEVPATDPKLLLGRNVEVSIAELTGDMKNPTRLIFKIASVENRNAHTIFGGYEVAREFVARLVRKRNDKVDIFLDVKTKDGWSLQVSALMMMNRNTYRNIQTSARKLAASMIIDSVSKMAIDEFISSIALEKRLQTSIRAAGNKIYPVRFIEITKVEVLKAPDN